MIDKDANVTTSHQEIKRWVEDRGGVPVSVEQTASGDDPGVLRIDFPGHGDEEGFRKLSWDEFFAKFDEKRLAFLYQEETADGGTSRFCKFIDRTQRT